MQKSKIIVYGLGSDYEFYKYFLQDCFEIVAYSDKDRDKWEKFEKGIPVEKIKNYPFDYIYVTPYKYVEEIKQELLGIINIEEKVIFTIKDMWWHIPNVGKRDEWIINKVREIPGGLTLLDAGAGNMPYKKYCSHLNYISQDFGEYDNSTDEKGLQVNEWHSLNSDIISDIVDIPLKNNSVDVILCSEVFEHIKDPIKALQEFARLIKSNGTLLLTAPFCSLTHMAPYYFANGFSPYWYEEHLREAGFELQELVPYGNWFTYMAQELERFPYVAQRYGKKVGENVNKLIVEIVKVLMEQNKEDSGSNELLCHGYLVRAQKR